MQSNILRNRALHDLYIGGCRVHVWAPLGWRDIRLRYRRTVFGPFWTTLTTGIFVGVLGLVYSTLWNTELTDYLPYLSAGVIVWSLFITILSESCDGFTTFQEVIRSTTLPYSISIYRILWRNLIVYLHNICIHILIIISFAIIPSSSLILLPLGVLLLLTNGLWLGYLLAAVCSRYRDMVPLVGSILQILFFVTPVLWRIELAGNYAPILATWNPVYHLIEVVRAPMLMQVPSLTSYSVVAGMAILGVVATVLVVGRVHVRIPYWI